MSKIIVIYKLKIMKKMAKKNRIGKKENLFINYIYLYFFNYININIYHSIFNFYL